MSSKIHTKNEKKMKRDTLGSLPFKGPGYLFVSFNHQGVGLPAAMEAHKVAEGDPFHPPPKTPYTPFRSN